MTLRKRNGRCVQRAMTLVLVAGAFTATAACTRPSALLGEIDATFGPVAGEARAIANCESKMDPNAVSPTDDHGLFQINGVHQGSFTKVTGQPWSAIYDPHHNAQFAKWLYDRQGWRPWTCARKVGL
jgi:hypothetical protein